MAETVEVQKSILDDLIKATTEKERQKFVIIPKTFEEAEKYAEFVAKSQLLPKGMGKNEVFLIIQVGLELGLSPMQALKGMFCVNNRVSIYGDLAVALVLRSGQMEVFDEDNAATTLKQGFGRCRVKRKGSTPCRIDPSKPEIKCLDAAAQKSRECCLEHRFSLEDAKAANLLDKDGPWKQYRGRMLQMRPRSWALRDQYADVLMGMSIYEEVIDIPTPHTNAIVEETMAAPKRKSEATKEPTPPAASDKEPLVVVDPPSTATAPDDAKEGSGEYLIENIEVVSYKGGKGEDKKFYKLTAAGGQGFATFSDSEADLVRTCITKKQPVSISWKRSPGKQNLAVKSLAPVISESEIPDEREAGQEG
jgi:hypothetical protein